VRERIIAANDATYEAWNAHDPDAVAAIFAPDAEAYDDVRGASFSRFDDDGLVIRDVHFWDVPTLLAQLGAS